MASPKDTKPTPKLNNESPSIRLQEQYGPHNYAPIPVVLVKGEGVYLTDEDGKRYLDFMSAYSANNYGHAHPVMLEALIDQAKTLSLTSRAYYDNQLGHFLEKLARMAGLDRVLPMNTGAEAVETAIKAARRWGYEIKKIPQDKAQIIVCENNFHGRTTTIVGFSSSEESRRGFGPFTPGFVTVKYGDAKAFEAAITPNTAAFLLEPIQGESGIIIPPDGYLKEVEKICRKHNVLMLVDEIQSGLGRTGKMFCFQHEGVKPDGIMLAKALGGGLFPVSAFVARNEIMDLFTPGSHGSTWGGNPLAARIGLTSLNLLEKEDLVRKSAELGDYLLTQLKKIKSPLITGLRGRGLWVGMDINAEAMSAKKVSMYLAENGLLTKETRAKTLRLSPPLIITKAQLDDGIGIFEKTFRQLDS